MGMFNDSYLMSKFPLPPLDLIVVLDPIHMISSVTSGSFGPYYPWVVFNSSNIELFGVEMPLSSTKKDYKVIHSTLASTDSSTQPDVGLDEYSFPNCVISPSISHDFINDVLPFDEAIMEVMVIEDGPW
jgi:hypothetical protein